MVFNGETESADVLFVGSSRSMASLVHKRYMRTQLQLSDSKYKTVDYILTTGPEQASKASLAMNYVQNLGAPKIVILENLFLQKGPGIEKQYKDNAYLSPTPTSQKYMDWRNYSKIQSEMRSINGKNVLDVFDVRYTNGAEFLMGQFSTSFYEILKNPSMLAKTLTERCNSGNIPKIAEDENKDRFNDRNGRAQEWIKKTEDKFRLDSATAMSKNAARKMRNRANSLLPLDPNSENRIHDVTAMKQFIGIFEDIGVEKIYVWLPGDYNNNYDEQTHSALKAHYSDVDKVYYPELVELYDSLDPDKIFYNRNHVNKFGAIAVANFWVEEISKIE